MGIQATNHPTSPLNRMSPYLKRKHDPACLDFIEANEMVEPKKICIELVCAAAAAAATTTTTTPMTPSSEPSSTQNGHKEENKENDGNCDNDDDNCADDDDNAWRSSSHI